MIQNVGSIDRTMRVMLAIVLLGCAFLSGLPVFDVPLIKFGAAIIGGVMLVTTSIRICPIYSIFGFRTCRN